MPIKYLEDSFKGPFEVKTKPLWFHEKGLMQTATGYGSKLKTSWMIKIENRWHRVYCRIYSNIGSLFIMKGHRQYIIKYDSILEEK